jgi:DNA-binding beta-propeller fold protein YncE
MTTARRSLLLYVALAASMTLAACAGTRPVPDFKAVWPPEASHSPGEVVWVGSVTETRPGGMGRFFRAVAGQEQTGSKWRFRRPISVAVHESRMVVVDVGSGVVVWARTDGGHAKILDLPSGFLPVAVTVSNDGKAWFVADGPTGELRRFDDQGRLSGVIQPQGEIRRCGGIAAAGDGDLLLTDVEGGEVLRVGPGGTVRARAGGVGVEPGRFNRPTAVVEDPDGTVWVLDALNFRVQHLDSRLRYLGHFGTHGDGSGHLALPRGLAVDPDGHLYVSDAQFDLIQLFDADGQLLLTVGGRGAGVGEFWSPAGLACDERGTVVVADAGNSRVQVLEYRRRRSGS